MTERAEVPRSRLRALLDRLESWPRELVFALCAAILLGFAYVDYATGWEITISTFYLLPIGLASWYVGRWAGTVLAGTGAALSIAGDILAGISFSHPLIPAWNWLVRLAGFMVIVVVLDELHRVVHAATGLARSDPLTGLPNARAFNEHAARITAQSARYGRPVALAFLDLDGLKAIHDSVGHAAGDVLLCLAADTMTSFLRASDVAARVGGDEFLVLLPETDLTEATAAVAKLQTAFAGLAEHAGFTARLSAGIVACASAPATIQPLIARADQLMYAAKRGGSGLLAETYVAVSPGRAARRSSRAGQSLPPGPADPPGASSRPADERVGSGPADPPAVS